MPYTFDGLPVADEEGGTDSSGNGTTPTTVDLASGSPNGADPGPEDTAFFGYYDGGTTYDPDDPSTMDDDYILFTMRLAADVRAGTQANKTDFVGNHYNILLDLDDDGYKEFWVDLEGSYASGNNVYDRLQILYDNSNNQDIADPDAARVEQYRAYHSADAGGYSHTRARAVGDGTGDWYIDIQVPMTAFKDLLGNQKLFPDSPVGFVFTTGTSPNNPMQKDFMTDINYTDNANPIDFGDIIKSNGDPIPYYADSALNEVFSYLIGDYIYLYLRAAPEANQDINAIETLTVTVSNPATGDDETVTLVETNESSGIFTSLGGATEPVSSAPNSAWSPYVRTSSSTVSEDWTFTFNGTVWTGTGNVSGAMTNTATAGTYYTSDGGEVSFTIYHNGTPATGATITFSTIAGDVLGTTTSDGTMDNTDDSGSLEAGGGDVINYTYSHSTCTVTVTATIVAPGEPFIQFTRSDGTPSENFNLKTDPALSDKLFVTVTHADSNTDSGLAETITVSISGYDSETITLTETGPDTGIFRNSGLNTKVSDGTVTAGDALWEDVDSGVTTATFTYISIDYWTTATLFYTDDAGRVYLTNGAGTTGVTQYSAGEPVFVRVEDASFTCGGTMSAIVNSSGGDSETVYLYETSTGSAAYMNRYNDLSTTAGSKLVSSASSTFVSWGLGVDDYFVIATGPDAGTYLVNSVVGETQVTLKTSMTATRTGDSFSPFPLMTATGSPMIGNGLLEASNGDTITVFYEDCTDGDLDSSNDWKTDSATYNAPPIVINEVLFLPDEVAGATPYKEFEYVVMYNASGSAIDVTDYVISDGDSFNYTVPQYGVSNISLGASESLYVVLIGKTSPTQPGVPPYHDIANGVYYFFHLDTVISNVVGSNSLGDPYTTDPSDQITLYDSTGIAVDYVAWSNTSVTTTDFRNDDSDAVAEGIWADNNYLDVSGISNGTAIRRTVDGLDSDSPSDWTLASSAVFEDVLVTQALVTRLEAYAVDGKVTVEWETASEMGTLGFYLYRLDPASGVYKKVNKSLIPSLALTMNAWDGQVAEGAYEVAPRGGIYMVTDEKAATGESLTYVLEEIEVAGATRRFGPYAFGQVEGAATGASALRSGYGAYTVHLEDGTYVITDSEDFISGGAGLHMVKARAHSILKDYPEGARRADYSASALSTSGRSHWKRDAGTVAARVMIEAPHVYYLGAADVSEALGISEKDAGRYIKAGHVALSTTGSPVPYQPEGTNGLYFHGQPSDTIYTDSRAYRVELGPGARMTSASGKGSAPVVMGHGFTHTVVAEQDRNAPTALFNDPDGDFWLWDYVIAGVPGLSSRSYAIELPRPIGSGDAELTINLKGVMDLGQGPDNKVRVYLNGSSLGEGLWEGTDALTLTLPASAGLVNDGYNTVTVEGVVPVGRYFGIFYLDSFSVSYERAYEALGDYLEFTAQAGQTVTVRGFSAADIKVIGLAKSPFSLTGMTIARDATSGGYSVSFVPESADITYVAFTGGAASVADVSGVFGATGLVSSPGAEFLVIAPYEFEEAALELVSYRRAGGLASEVAYVEDIVDEFGHGAYGPHAIREFLVYAYEHWGVRPRYVVLLGDGTYDYKGALAPGWNKVPVFMVGTPDGLYPSDAVYADLAGDAGPEIAVGRIPVKTNAEGLAVVAKIKAYESAVGTSWQRETLLLAGEKDPGGTGFIADSDAVGRILEDGGNVAGKLYLDKYAIGTARKTFVGKLDAGVGLVNYLGHGGIERLSSQGVLTVGDVRGLKNAERPMVLTAMTCVTANFSIPGFDSVGETLLTHSGGGAVAVWGASGLSATDGARVLNEAFYGYLAGQKGGIVRVGDAVLGAHEAYEETNGSVSYINDIYNLLGDPALRVR